MKSLHWIIFSLAVWIAVAPFIGDDLFVFLTGEALEKKALLELLRWDGLIIGLAVSVTGLIIVIFEQVRLKHPGLIAMHWMQVILGFWIGIAPFGFSFTFEAFTMSHALSGIMVAIFAILQISFEQPDTNQYA